MRTLLLLTVGLLAAVVAACSSRVGAGVPSISPLDPALRQSQRTRAHHAVEIDHVFVARACFDAGSCGGSGGTNELDRYPAATSTSSPGESISLSFTPEYMAVNPNNGRLALSSGRLGDHVWVYDKNLNPLYDFAPHKPSVHSWPDALAYDADGNLYVGMLNPEYYGGNQGAVEVFYGEDTTADKTFSSINPAELTASTSGGNEYFWPAKLTPSYGFYIYICSWTGGLSCTNTGIENNSRVNPSFAYYQQPFALIGEGGGSSGSELVQAYCTYPYQACYSGDSYLQYWTASGPSTWTLTESDRVCNGGGQYTLAVNTDRQGTVYWSCAGNGVVHEKTATGATYAINAGNYPVAVGAY